MRYGRAVEDAFRYDKLVLATTTYNSEIFPFMRYFIDLAEGKKFPEKNSSIYRKWILGACCQQDHVRRDFEDMKHMTIANEQRDDPGLASLNEESTAQIDALADELSKGYLSVSAKTQAELDPTALFKIGYGLYVVTCNDGKRTMVS